MASDSFDVALKFLERRRPKEYSPRRADGLSQIKENEGITKEEEDAIRETINRSNAFYNRPAIDLV